MLAFENSKTGRGSYFLPIGCIFVQIFEFCLVPQSLYSEFNQGSWRWAAACWTPLRTPASSSPLRILPSTSGTRHSYPNCLVFTSVADPLHFGTFRIRICGSVPLTNGSADPDPDPDPAPDPDIFVIDLQDTNNFFWVFCWWLLKVHLHQFSKSLRSHHKTVVIKVLLNIFAWW